MNYKAIVVLPLFIFLAGVFTFPAHNEAGEGELPRQLIRQLEKQVFQEPENEIISNDDSGDYLDAAFMSDQSEVYLDDEQIGVLIPEYQGFVPADYR